MNHGENGTLAVSCPNCDHEFEVERCRLGGILGYPLDELHEEVAFIAYHFHWDLTRIMDLEHEERRVGWRRSPASTSARTRRPPCVTGFAG